MNNNVFILRITIFMNPNNNNTPSMRTYYTDLLHCCTDYADQTQHKIY